MKKLKIIVAFFALVYLASCKSTEEQVNDLQTIYPTENIIDKVEGTNKPGSTTDESGGANDHDMDED